MLNNEEKFQNWLKTKVKQASTVQTYINALNNKLPKQLELIDLIKFQNILELQDLKYLEDVLNRLKDGNLKEYNKNTQNQLPHAALKKYIIFLKELNSSMQKQKKQPLNQILYGPPGTGKTYNTINKAIEIINYEFYSKNKNDRTILKEKFEQYKSDGQIEFITFHQSYGYEEFVEGIKADLESDEIRYTLEDGIFKQLSDKANQNYKYNYAYIHSSNFEEAYNRYVLQLSSLKTKRKMISIEDKTIKVYKENKSCMIEIKGKGQKISIEMLRKTFDKYDTNSYNIAILEDILSQEPIKNYLLIIDEINRGNISKIFGELITLIEPSKRIGEEEEIQLKLPNSKKLFGVPSNLYIIGTMNTADRSIAQIDTALRRRFVFEEMMPKQEFLNKINIDGINISKVFQAINERIEYIYDREHMIGHSYFMPLLQTSTKEKLDEIFRVNIIPLLTEYFYGDWGDIKTILNNNFIIEKELKYKPKDRNIDNIIYKINDEFTLNEYKNIYNNDNSR